MKEIKNNLVVKGIDVNYKRINKEDYICLTDMLKAKDGDFFITDWIRNRNTLEYIGVWEKINNSNFNYGEFAIIKNQAGLNNFKISVKELVSKTNAISIYASSGRYGGTYAHKDIAFKFASWISVEFELYLIKEFQRLKEKEVRELEWNAKRELAKVNYKMHTSAIQNNLIIPELSKEQIYFTYASEADLLNVALFGITASEWRKENEDKTGNMRDYASVEQLLVLSNMESYNSTLIDDGLSQSERIVKLNNMAKNQMKILLNKDLISNK